MLFVCFYFLTWFSAFSTWWLLMLFCLFLLSDMTLHFFNSVTLNAFRLFLPSDMTLSFFNLVTLNAFFLFLLSDMILSFFNSSFSQIFKIMILKLAIEFSKSINNYVFRRDSTINIAISAEHELETQSHVRGLAPNKKSSYKPRTRDAVSRARAGAA